MPMCYQPPRTGNVSLRLSGAVIMLMALTSMISNAGAQTAAPLKLNGTLTAVRIDDPADPASGGRIAIDGQAVIVPAPVPIEFPGDTVSVAGLFERAPAACRAQGESGLVPGDRCRKPVRSAKDNGRVWTVDADDTPRSPEYDAVPTDNPPPTTARVVAMRDGAGRLVASKVTLTRADTSVSGAVTFVNPLEGYLRVNGAFGLDAGGAVLRINDPEARQSVQIGRGCGDEGNCSPDARFRINAAPPSVRFQAGYAACVPSQMNGACLPELRPVRTYLDANAVIPIVKGDHVTARGGFEVRDGSRIFWAHTLIVQSSPNSGRP